MAKPGDEKKEGVTVQQLESFGKNHRIEIFFCIVFILASFFSFAFYGAGWSIYAAGIGGVVSVWIPKVIGRIAHGAFRFCISQQKVTRIVIAVVACILSIFLAPLVFLCIGLMAGRSFHRHAMESMKMSGCSKESCGDDEAHS